MSTSVATYRGRLVRDLAVPNGVDSVDLSFELIAGAAPKLSTFEVGCSLFLRPDPQAPADDRRFIVRAAVDQMTFQWNGEAPTIIGSPTPAARVLRLQLRADPGGTSFGGTLIVGGLSHVANLASLSGPVKAIRLECGLVSGAAMEAPNTTRDYSVSVDNVALSVCARP